MKYWQVISGGTFAVVAKAEALLVIIMSRMLMLLLLLMCKKHPSWSTMTITINPRAPRFVAVDQEVIWPSLDISPLCKMSTIEPESGKAR